MKAMMAAGSRGSIGSSVHLKGVAIAEDDILTKHSNLAYGRESA
jgi:hypothetical protein